MRAFGMPQTLDVEGLMRAVASILGMSPNSTPPSHWSDPCENAIDFARGVVSRALAARGFKPEQVAAWDDYYQFHRRVALCNVFREGGIGRDAGFLNLGEYCKAVGELASAPVTIGGLVVDPSGLAGGCSSGEFAFTREVNVPGGFAHEGFGADNGAGTDPDAFGRGWR